MAWHPTHTTPAPVPKLSAPEPEKAEQTDLNLDPEADHDQFSHFDSDQPTAEKKFNAEDVPSAAGTAAEALPRNRAGVPFAQAWAAPSPLPPIVETPTQEKHQARSRSKPRAGRL